MIHSKIIVDENVPHSHDLWPWEGWCAIPRLLSDSRCRLANQLDAMHQSMPQQHIRLQFGAVSTGHNDDGIAPPPTYASRVLDHQ